MQRYEMNVTQILNPLFAMRWSTPQAEDITEMFTKVKSTQWKEVMVFQRCKVL